MIDYPFTEQEMQAASDEWGANCGPSALAFALQIGLDKVRGVIPGFDEKRYTSPTMMIEALVKLKVGIIKPMVSKGTMFEYRTSLVRVQWTGPWTKPGANPKWAYRQTHWIATWEKLEERGIEGRMCIFNQVFDCNGGIRSVDSWEKEIVPILTKQTPRADGGWFPTHIWRLKP